MGGARGRCRPGSRSCEPVTSMSQSSSLAYQRSRATGPVLQVEVASSEPSPRRRWSGCNWPGCRSACRARRRRQLIYQMASPGPTQGTLRRVNGAIMTALAAGMPTKLDIIISAEWHAGGWWKPLDLRSDEMRAMVRAAAAAETVTDADPDPDSAAYRELHEAARRELVPLAGSDLMRPLPAAKPPKPDNTELRQVKRAAETLNAFVSECDRYWFKRWGTEGNL